MTGRVWGRIWGLALATAAIAMTNAAAASAAALYVDDSGNDNGGTNDCTVPGLPCATIEQAHDQLGPGNVIHLGGGTYPELVFIDDGDSLIEDSTFSPAAAGQALINPSSTTVPAVQMYTTGTVSGLTISSPFTAVFIDGSGALSNNLFSFGNVPLGQYNADVVVSSFTSAAPTISGNSFSDPDPESTSPNQIALVLNTTGSPVVTDNTFAGFHTAILALSPGGATPTITGNVITGTYDTNQRGTGIGIADGVEATLVGNSVFAPGTGVPFAVEIFQNSMANEAGATLQRNRIIGHQVGVNAQGNTLPVTLSSDLIAKANGGGLITQQQSGHGIGASATNATIVDTVSASDVIVGTGTTLTLDSSIVGAGAAPVGIDAQGTGACTITFTRGTGDDGCAAASGFTTTANPMFVNPAANDYHLLAGSPMIDAGNPATPAAGALDLDGDQRAFAIPAACGGTPPTPRRDIGADEYSSYAVPAIGCPKPGKPKCKKRKKGKGKGKAGAAAKRCKKKRKKK